MLLALRARRVPSTRPENENKENREWRIALRAGKREFSEVNLFFGSWLLSTLLSYRGKYILLYAFIT